MADNQTLGAALVLGKKNISDPEVVAEAVGAWLDDHPEATTTVQDGSISKAKLDSNLKGKVDDVDELKSAINEHETEISVLQSTVSGKIMLTSEAVNTLIDILTETVTASDISVKLAVLEEELQYVEPVIQLCYIANNLTHATTSNSAMTVNKGSVYSATITADSTYTLENITVTMGGVDITSTAVSGNAISISEVTGDLVITAIAEKTIYLTPIRTSGPNDTTYEYSASTWYTGMTFENKTISGGRMTVTFDDGIATNFQFRVCILDSNKAPYECAGYKNPQNVSVQGEWEPYYYAVGTTGLSYATAAKTFYFDVPDGYYAFIFVQFSSGVVYGGQEVTDNNQATTWALNGGVTVGIKGGVEDEQ